MDNGKKTARYELKISPEMKAAVRVKASREGKSLAYVIRELLREWLADELGGEDGS